MQFEVATHRMATEFSAPIALESLFSTPWRRAGFQRDNRDVKLGSLVAA